VRDLSICFGTQSRAGYCRATELELAARTALHYYIISYEQLAITNMID